MATQKEATYRTVTVLTKRERQILKEIARSENRSVSGHIRHLIKQEIEEQGYSED